MNKKNKLPELSNTALYALLLCSAVLFSVAVFLFISDETADGIIPPGKGRVNSTPVSLQWWSVLFFSLLIAAFPLYILLKRSNKEMKNQSV